MYEYFLAPLLTYLTYVFFYVKIDESNIDMVLIRRHLFKGISLVVTFIFVVMLNQIVSYILFKDTSFNEVMAFISVYLGLICVIFKKIDHVKFDHQQFHRNLNECKNTLTTGLTEKDFNNVIDAIRKKQTLTHMLFSYHTHIFFIKVHSKCLKVLLLHGTDSSPRNLLNHFSMNSSPILNKNYIENKSYTSFFKRFIGMLTVNRFNCYSYPPNGYYSEKPHGLMCERILSVRLLLNKTSAPVHFIYEIDKESLQDDLTSADYSLIEMLNFNC